MPNTQPVQSLVQPPVEDIRNSIQIAQLYAEMDYREGYGPRASEVVNAFQSIARLLTHAIEGLSEPNLAAMQAGEVLLREWSGTPEPQRQLRDTISGIISAQISGIVPRTWSHE